MLGGAGARCSADNLSHVTPDLPDAMCCIVTGAESVKRALFTDGYVLRVGYREHAAAREHGMHALGHFYASVLLDAGESIKALAEYLGHSDPGLTLTVYAHLMPSSRDRARKALGRALRPLDPTC